MNWGNVFTPGYMLAYILLSVVLLLRVRMLRHGCPVRFNDTAAM